MIPYKLWKESVDKWEEILARTKQRMEWDVSDGWKDLTVKYPCGYCEYAELLLGEYDDLDGEEDKESCDFCSLYKNKLCIDSNDINSDFWIYCNNMEIIRCERFRGSNYEEVWKKSEEKAENILNFILNDEHKPEEQGE